MLKLETPWGDDDDDDVPIDDPVPDEDDPGEDDDEGDEEPLRTNGEPEIKRKGLPREPFAGGTGDCGLLLADDRHGDRHRHVGVQHDLDRELAHLLERPLRHAHLRALDVVPLLLERLDDVVVGDRAEETSVDARLLADLELQVLELRRAFLRLGQGLVLRLLHPGAAPLEVLDVLGRGALRLAVRDEIVAREAVLHLDHVAQVSEVRYLLHEDDLHAHFPLGLVEVGVRQQREEARALDRVRELALVARRGAGDARGDDLAGLVDEVLQDLDVLVVDPFDLLGGEAAELAAAEKCPLALVLLVLAELPLALSLTFARRRHALFPFPVLRRIRCWSRAARASSSACSWRREIRAASVPCSVLRLPGAWPAQRTRCRRFPPPPSEGSPLRPAPTRAGA